MTKQRCYNPRCADYRYYGGRGIAVCRRWLDSFDNFVVDMGLRPPGMTLERKNNDKGYSKSNCVWATRREQSANTRQVKNITWEGVTDTVAGWERRKGFKPGTLKARLGLLGYTVEQAMTKLVQYGGVIPGKVYKQRVKPVADPEFRGLKHPLTKLTKLDVLRMRKAALVGATFSKLAREYGVTVTTASNAVQKKGAYQNV